MQITKIVTDETLRELREHGTEAFPFQYNHEELRQYDEEKIEWHWHKEFEFVQVVEGSLFFLVGGMRIELQEGDGLFINSRIIHSLENHRQGVISNILFSSSLIAAEKSIIYKKYIQEICESDKSHIVFKKETPWQKTFLVKLGYIFRICQGENELNELDMHICLCKLWNILYIHRKEMVNMEKSGISIRSQSRLRKMVRYIEQNYAEKLFLGDIASAANISKSEAMRCFQIGMQTSPIECLNNYRLHIAKQELETTENSIVHIALETGFEDGSYFTRLFKRTYGVTPREARKSSR